jgi:hypothetical protein
MVSLTSYPNANDPVQQRHGQQAMQTFRNAAAAGVLVVVVDDHSDVANFNGDQPDGVIVLPATDDDMVTNLQHAVSHALSNTDVTHLAVNVPINDVGNNLHAWTSRMLDESAAVLLPMRTDTTSYPAAQAHSEYRGNRALQEEFGHDVGDQHMGTWLYSRDAATRHLLRPYEQYGTKLRKWGALHAPVFGAMVTGDCVVGLPVDHPNLFGQTLSQHLPLSAEQDLRRELVTAVAGAVIQTLSTGQWNFRLLDGFGLDRQTRTQPPQDLPPHPEGLDFAP